MSTNGGGEGALQKPTFEEALANMPTRDCVDRLAIFTAEQSEALRRLIEAQSTAMFGIFELMRERFRLLDGEIARLKAERHGGSPNSNGFDRPNGAGTAS